MSTIDDLISAFTAQSQAALTADTSPWQQELLETVNPEKQRRRNIAKALQQASLAMAQTRGSFLDGLSAAAATGAGSYITGQQENEDYAAKVRQAVALDQAKQQDRRLELLYRAIGVKRDQAETDAKVAWYNRRGTDTADGELNANQTRNTKQYIDQTVKNFRKQLSDLNSADYVDDPNERKRLVMEEQDRLEKIFGVKLLDEKVAAPQVGALDQNVTQFDMMTGGGDRGGITGGDDISEGTTAVNPQTGERIVYRNGQWLPL